MSSWDEVHIRVSELASSKVSFQRLAAANALGAYADEPAAISLLTRLSEDEDQAVREASLALLGKTKSNEPFIADEGPTGSSNKSLSIEFRDTSRAQRSVVPLEFLNSKSSDPNTDFPVPQANSLDAICALIAESQVHGRSIRDCLTLGQFSPRQWDYYENAIGFLELDGFEFAEPEDIEKRSKLSLRDFVDFTSVLISRHEVIRRIVQGHILLGHVPSNDEVQEMVAVWIAQLGRPKLADDTLGRRRQTVQAWASWITDHLQSVSDFTDGTECAELEPVDLTPGVVALLGCLDTEIPKSSKRVYQKAYYKAKPRVTYKSEDLRKVLERLGRFTNSSGPTLGQVGVRHSVTRERIRQIEVKFSTLIQNVVKTDGIEALTALRRVSSPLMPIDLADWLLGSLKFTLTESESALEPNDPKPPHELSLIELMEEGRSLEKTLFDEYGPEPVERLPGWANNELEFGFALLRGALDSAGYESGQATNDLWVRSDIEHDERLRELIWPVSEQSRNRTQRLERIKEALAQRPMRTSELAAQIGERSAQALREFMSRQPDLSFRRGIWSIANSGDQGESFRSIYDALVFVLEQGGPATTGELMERLADIHSVSYTRLLQALDDHRIGRFQDGRIGLLSQGAARGAEKEPEIPPRLVVKEPHAELLLTVNGEHLRGSGFGIPSWLGWRLGLVATPDSAELSGPNGQEITITRRGGQCYSGTIRKILDQMSAQLNCSVGIEIDLERRRFEARHLCLEH